MPLTTECKLRGLVGSLFNIIFLLLQSNRDLVLVKGSHQGWLDTLDGVWPPSVNSLEIILAALNWDRICLNPMLYETFLSFCFLSRLIPDFIPTTMGDPLLVATHSPGNWLDLNTQAKAPSSWEIVLSTNCLKLASGCSFAIWATSLGITSVSVSEIKLKPFVMRNCLMSL